MSSETLWMLWHALASKAIAFFMAWLLIRAALHKLSDIPSFVSILDGYGFIFPAPLAQFATYTVVAIAVTEMLIACLLLIPMSNGIGALLAVGLFSFYLLLMVWQLYSQRVGSRSSVDCGCGGLNLSLLMPIQLCAISV